MMPALGKAPRIVRIVSILLLLVGFGLGSRGMIEASDLPQSVLPAGSGAGDKIAAGLQTEIAGLAPGAMTTAIVTLVDQADLSRIPGAGRAARQQGVIRALQAQATASQAQIRAFLRARQAQGLVSSSIPFWIRNGLSVTATASVFQELAARADVATITPDAISIVSAGSPAEPNIGWINAPALWALGYTGQGVVVANLDSGVDLTHPELGPRWRGGANSWYDPYGQHPAAPIDLSGHGTWTMGVMVGGDAGGTAVGVAPGATWMAARIFNDAGSATSTAIHLAFQWVLDPDGDPNTADAPDVINNSWVFGVPGCNLEFQLDLRSLRAAGILPVFAAGNFGPASSTSVSPANYPEVFAVGATDNSDAIYAYSSRGPSACGETQSIYPELVAPGVNVLTTDLYGLYFPATGTSLAAPHAAGALALLLSAYPNLGADAQAAALQNSATDLGVVGPDNTFGYGRLDVLAAYNWLLNVGVSTPTPTATAIDTALPPTATPTDTALPPTATATDTALPPTATSTATALPTATATPTALPTATSTVAPPTATATPTQAPPTPTRTATSAPFLHVGDLDRSTTTSTKGWTATVAIEVHNVSHALQSGVKVTGKWSGGTTGTVTCTTGSTGRCQVTTGTLANKITSVTYTVSTVTKTGYTYQAAANHDPDGDSNGTTITVSKP
jgi:serine protease AprX